MARTWEKREDKKKKEKKGGWETGEERKKARKGQVDAASAQESGPMCITEKHVAWESSNNAQRLLHNVPGATRGSGLEHPQEPHRTMGTYPSSLRRFLPRTFVPSCLFRSSSSAVEVGWTLGARYNQGSFGGRETWSRRHSPFVMHAARRGGLTELRPPRNEIKASGEAGRER